MLSETDSQLCLHEITLDPDIGLRQVFSLQSLSLVDEGDCGTMLYGGRMAKLSCSHTPTCLMLVSRARNGIANR